MTRIKGKKSILGRKRGRKKALLLFKILKNTIIGRSVGGGGLWHYKILEVRDCEA